jgi:O-antigen ligase
MAADHPVFGVGFGQDAYLSQYDLYKDPANEREVKRAAHSVWFSLLAETGYVGLGIYVLLLAIVLRTCRRVMKQAPPAGVDRKRHWTWNYGAALMIAIGTFAVGGSFLSQARFEYVFALLMAAVPLSVLAGEEAEATTEHREAMTPGRSMGQAASLGIRE